MFELSFLLSFFLKFCHIFELDKMNLVFETNRNFSEAKNLKFLTQ